MTVGFHRYETEPLELVIEKEGVEKPLEDYLKIAVSFDQKTTDGKCHIDILLDQGAPEVDVENSTINIHFTQEQSSAFMVAPANVEVNILYADRERQATCEGKVNIFRNLYDKEL